MPPLNEASDLYLSRSSRNFEECLAGSSAFGCRSFIFERFIGEDRGNLTKFKGFLRNLYLLFSRYEIFGGSRFTTMKNGEKDIDQCHI